MKRGDVYAFSPPRRGRGRGLEGRRYAVVLQGDALLGLSTVVVAPTSAGALASSYRPEIEITGRHTRILVEQLRAIDPSRLGRRIGTLAWDEMRSVDEALKVVLGLF